MNTLRLNFNDPDENALGSDPDDFAKEELSNESKNSQLVKAATIENWKLKKINILEELKNKDSILFKPSIPTKSTSLATYVNHSLTLQNLIRLGVDLTKVEYNLDIAEYLVKSDFKKDIQPYILFLHDHKVPATELAGIFTKNPKIFIEPLENLQLRIDYLKSKMFPDESIVRIITKVPSVLTTSTLVTDKQLGFLQEKFKLTGDEVRIVANKYPKLLVWKSNLISENKLHLVGVMGFTDAEVKKMLLTYPKLLTAGKIALAQRFDYLHNSIGLSHEDILQWPQVLKTRLIIIRQRHGFLKLLKRDQFDKKVENFVSLKSLVALSDEEFCKLVAKVPALHYNDYLKSL
ncbi:hypothetical protein HELRODRAFT_64786 [Helobdella robusta]|uniref:Uncharacterized protein n=1 Tax=Helobdella robusta TaxID=6412 RepID=T1FXZ3_HELRO|nr:hypothetical protein HELRODRAFT_64786 [Helobdella robusta]ESO06722.1 hypothetical protein HELRODRAFT_64786 [Helobdella robusta]